MSAERAPLAQEVSGGFIARQIAIVEGEIQPDNPELARKRQANRNRIEHNVFTYTGHEHKAGWNSKLFALPGGGRRMDDVPDKKPRGYSDAGWAAMQMKMAKKRA